MTCAIIPASLGIESIFAGVVSLIERPFVAAISAFAVSACNWAFFLVVALLPPYVVSRLSPGRCVDVVDPVVCEIEEEIRLLIFQSFYPRQ